MSKPRDGHFTDKGAKERRKRLSEGLPNRSWGAYIYTDTEGNPLGHAMTYERIGKTNSYHLACSCGKQGCRGVQWLRRLLKKYATK